MKNIIEEKYNEKALSYTDYRKIVNNLFEQNKTTGQDHSPEMLEYTKLNITRMNRLDKQFIITDDYAMIIKKISNPQKWYVLAEGWCGDAAQILPVLNHITSLNELLNLNILLRDENPELMDRYLYKGKSRSIPKLIVTDHTGLEIFNWGPRPESLQIICEELQNKNTPVDILKETIHKWYADNKGEAIVKEITTLLKGSYENKVISI